MRDLFHLLQRNVLPVLHQRVRRRRFAAAAVEGVAPRCQEGKNICRGVVDAVTVLVVSIPNFDRIWMDAGIIVLAILEPAVGRKAKVNLGEVVLSATVARVSPNLDERTRFAQLYLSLQNQTNLYPGSFIDVVIEGPRLRDTVLLPEAAEQINESVWTMSGGKLKKAQPKFINRMVSGVIVENFVTGDGVVLGTVPGAKEGMAVTTEPD